VGVIGVAYYAERRRVVRVAPRRTIARPRAEAPERYRGEDEASADASSSARDLGGAGAEPRKGRASSGAPAPSAEVNNLGTEYGETRESRVNEVSFVRRSVEPDWVVTLRYDDADGLSARGIELWPDVFRGEPDSPEPFPNSRFAAPP
jgi:hypothetical protein